MFDGPFRDYAEATTKQLIQDLVDGFFPSELEARYPDGVPFTVHDLRDRLYTGRGVRIHAWIVVRGTRKGQFQSVIMWEMTCLRGVLVPDSQCDKDPLNKDCYPCIVAPWLVLGLSYCAALVFG